MPLTKEGVWESDIVKTGTTETTRLGMILGFMLIIVLTSVVMIKLVTIAMVSVIISRVSNNRKGIVAIVIISIADFINSDLISIIYICIPILILSNVVFITMFMRLEHETACIIAPIVKGAIITFGIILTNDYAASMLLMEYSIIAGIASFIGGMMGVNIEKELKTRGII